MGSVARQHGAYGGEYLRTGLRRDRLSLLLLYASDRHVLEYGPGFLKPHSLACGRVWSTVQIR
jgi:hypothetical protein